MQKKLSKAEELIRVCEIQNSIAEIFLKEFLEKKGIDINFDENLEFDNNIVEKIENEKELKKLFF